MKRSGAYHEEDNERPTRKRACMPSSSKSNSSQRSILLELPPEVLESVFLKAGSYAEVARLRLVCRDFNAAGRRLLTKGFNDIQTKVQNRLHVIKSQMPRRESSRRKHPLARECDIMETLHMRLVLMQMTFGKHIEKSHCCFFAGEILDEIQHILRYTRSSAVLGRVYKVTDELFDLSTMAMEYFKEKIEPNLPHVSYFSTDLPIPPSNPLTYTTVLQRPAAGPSRLSSPESIPVPEVLKPIPILPKKASKGVSKRAVKAIRRDLRKANHETASLKREMRAAKAKIVHQNRQLKEYAARLEQHESRFDEQAQKLENLTADLSQLRGLLQKD